MFVAVMAMHVVVLGEGGMDVEVELVEVHGGSI